MPYSALSPRTTLFPNAHSRMNKVWTHPKTLNINIDLNIAVFLYLGTGTGSQYGGSTQYETSYGSTPYASTGHYGSVGNVGQSSAYAYGSSQRSGAGGASKPPVPPCSPYSSLKRLARSLLTIHFSEWCDIILRCAVKIKGLWLKIDDSDVGK